jgi:hypothetical protein
MSKTNWTTIWRGLAGALVMAAAGVSLPLPGDRDAEAAPQVKGDGSICAGGAASAIDLEFLPTAIERTGGGERLTAHLSVGNAFGGGGAAKLLYVVDVGADDGRAIGALVKSGNLSVAAGRSVDTDVQLPVLEDGFYRATVTVVGKSGNESADGQASVYWRVSGGRIEPMEMMDWHRQSPLGSKAVAP